MTEEQWLQKYYTKQPSGCWHWTGGINAKGYGKCAFRGNTPLAHRAAYIIYKGEIPQGLQVMHSCHNRLCVNPDHLSLGTHYANVKMSVTAGRKMGNDGVHSSETLQEVHDLRAMGFRYREIAEKTGVPINSIGFILHRRKRPLEMTNL